jgi:hypothetical protein
MVGEKNIRPTRTRRLKAQLCIREIVATLTGLPHSVCNSKTTPKAEAKLRLSLISYYAMKTHAMQQAFQISTLRPSVHLALGKEDSLFNGRKVGPGKYGEEKIL